MDFSVGLPQTRKKNYSICVIFDRLMKSSHIIPIRSTNLAEEYTRLYLNEIVSLHGIPLSTISNIGSQFTSRFWRSFKKGLGTQVKLSTTFHP